MRIRDVALKTCQKRWTIGRSGDRGSGISVLAVRHDDDIYIYIYIYIYINAKYRCYYKAVFVLCFLASTCFTNLIVWQHSSTCWPVTPISVWFIVRILKTQRRQIADLSCYPKIFPTSRRNIQQIEGRITTAFGKRWRPVTEIQNGHFTID